MPKFFLKFLVPKKKGFLQFFINHGKCLRHHGNTLKKKTPICVHLRLRTICGDKFYKNLWFVFLLDAFVAKIVGARQSCLESAYSVQKRRNIKEFSQSPQKAHGLCKARTPRRGRASRGLFCVWRKFGRGFIHRFVRRRTQHLGRNTDF